VRTNVDVEHFSSKKGDAVNHVSVKMLCEIINSSPPQKIKIHNGYLLAAGAVVFADRGVALAVVSVRINPARASKRRTALTAVCKRN